MAAHDVTPNRSVLLDLKRRIKLTKSGYKILKMKRDGLIIEFFEVLEKARKMREGVSADYDVAMEKITIARAVEGEIAVRSAAYALKADPQVKLSSKSIMGMMVPKVEADWVHTNMTEKGYGVISTSPYIEGASNAFEKDEIEKTKRRVNALEYKIIPELQEAERFVKFSLEEMDRENTTRLKHLKSKGAAEE